ncbi:MAG: hypothetical protein AAFQ34_02090 [Pseudomonadota bacterium]
MKKSTQLLGAVSAVALVAMSSAPAMAEGIRAGTVVTNTVTVDYQVGGVDQTQIEATDQFSVDRRINVDVTFAGAGGGDSAGNPFDAAPGSTGGPSGVALVFDVTNLSNDTVDLDLNAVLAADVGSNGTITAVFVDTNGNGVVDAGEEVDFLANVLADETRQVTVLVDIDIAADDGETLQVDLNANAFVAGSMTAGGTGTEYVETGSNSTDPSTVDTALVDDNSTFSLDADRDGSDTDRAFVEVDAANVSVVKSSLVVSDPVNGTTNPKAIPGAVIRYCIAVANSGGADAENIVVSDALPGEVNFNTGTIRRNTDASISSGVATCDATSGDTATDSTADSDGGGFTSGTNTVAGTLDDVAGSTTSGFMFEVTIAPAVDNPNDTSTTDTVTAALDTDNPD